MHYRICNDGIEDQWIEADDPVEIEPGVIKLYGDCTPDEIQAAKTHWNRITAILDELDRLGRPASTPTPSARRSCSPDTRATSPAGSPSR